MINHNIFYHNMFFFQTSKCANNICDEISTINDLYISDIAYTKIDDKSVSLKRSTKYIVVFNVCDDLVKSKQKIDMTRHKFCDDLKYKRSNQMIIVDSLGRKIESLKQMELLCVKTLDYLFNFDINHDFKTSIIDISLKNERLDILQYLINHQNVNFGTKIVQSFVCQCNNPTMMEFSLKNIKYDDFFENIMLNIINYENVIYFSLLLKYVLDQKTLCDLLFCVIKTFNDEFLDILLKEIDYTKMETSNYDYLIYLFKYGHVDYVKYFVENEIGSSIKEHHIQESIKWVQYSDDDNIEQLDYFQYLSQKFPEIKIDVGEILEELVGVINLGIQHVDILTKYGIDIMNVPIFNEYLLSSYDLNEDVWNYFINNGFHVNDIYEKTILNLIDLHYMPTIELITKIEPNYFASDNHQKYVHHAIFKCGFTCLQYFIDIGVDIFAQKNDILSGIFDISSPQMMKILLKNGLIIDDDIIIEWIIKKMDSNSFYLVLDDDLDFINVEKIVKKISKIDLKMFQKSRHVSKMNVLKSVNILIKHLSNMNDIKNLFESLISIIGHNGIYADRFKKMLYEIIDIINDDDYIFNIAMDKKCMAIIYYIIDKNMYMTNNMMDDLLKCLCSNKIDTQFFPANISFLNKLNENGINFKNYQELFYKFIPHDITMLRFFLMNEYYIDTYETKSKIMRLIKNDPLFGHNHEIFREFDIKKYLASFFGIQFVADYYHEFLQK